VLVLIKREIQDHLILFILTAIATSIFTSIVVCDVSFKQYLTVPIGVPNVMFGILWLYTPLLLLGSAFLGATQMYIDRTQKISTFLSTLATTRQKILAAKIIAGLLWMLLVLVPFVAADVILLHIFPCLAPLDISFPVKILVTILLSSLCCYVLGLQMGWQVNKRSAILGSIILAPVVLSVVVIKGFGVQTIIILSLFVITMFIRIWQRFMSSSL